MRFIDPKIDYAFKKIFGSAESHDILISFLNALIYGGRNVIQEVEIIDPYLAPKLRGMKDTYVDVKATIKDEADRVSSVIIEMQVLNVEGFEKRILYNAAKAYSMQLEVEKSYSELEPVIALTITDFIMFPDIDHFISQFILKEKTYLTDYISYDIELIFVELPKFHKELEELETITDKWIYFITSTRNLHSVPPQMATVAEINKALQIAEQANMTPAELDEIERRVFFISDQKNAITKAVNQGLQKGLQEGLQEGLKQGLQQGLQEGILQGELNAKLTIARQLLPILDDQSISNSTGLSLAQISQLRQEIPI